MRNRPLSLSILFLSLITFSSYAYAEKKTPEQYWTETGISTELLPEFFLKNSICNSDATKLRGCVKAIEAIANTAEPMLSVIPSSLLKDPEVNVKRVILEKISDADGLALVELNRDDSLTTTSVRAGWKKTLNLRNKIKSANEALLSKQLDYEKILQEVVKQSIKDPAKDAAAAAAAVNAALVESIDAHAHIDAAAEAEDSRNDADEGFTGIGVELRKLNSSIVALKVLDGGPASRAGLLANDIINTVDGESVDKVPFNTLVMKKIRGPENTVVTLGLIRSGKNVELKITRSKVVFVNVSTEVKTDFSTKIGVIRLKSFTDSKACLNIENKIKELETSGATALVLDLRGNGGGLVNQAVCIGGLFVGKKIIVRTLSLSNNLLDSLPASSDAVTNLPLAVLIDSSSASASELLAGALQDYGRAWVLGERSFGKGSVQSPRPFMAPIFGGKIMLYKTTDRFYQPSGRTNQVVGISPDFEVPFKVDATEDERFSLREGDLFPNSLDAVGEPWVNPRLAEVQNINAVIKTTGELDSTMAKLKSENIDGDYQMLYAESVLKWSKYSYEIQRASSH